MALRCHGRPPRGAAGIRDEARDRVQIHDDCLDLFGSEKVAGKSLGTDLASGKLTLPVLIFLERATPGEQTRLKELIETWQPEFHDRTVALLEKHDALAASAP